MLNRILLCFILFISFSAQSKLSEEMTYGSIMLQVKLAKFEEKQEKCITKVKNYTLSDEIKMSLVNVDSSISKGLYFLYKKSLDNCYQPELFQLSQSLLQLQELNKKENDENVNNQINLIRQLVFSGGDIDDQKYYDVMPQSQKDLLDSIPELKRPFDSLKILEFIQQNTVDK